MVLRSIFHNMIYGTELYYIRLYILIALLSCIHYMLNGQSTARDTACNSAHAFWIYQEYAPSNPSPDQHQLFHRLAREINPMVTQSQLYQRQLQQWEAGPPFFRWQNLMTSLSQKYPQQRNGGRMAHFFAAIYDATQLVSNHLPNEIPPQITCYPKHLNPEYAMVSIAVAATSAEILNYYFPEAQSRINALAQDHFRTLSSLGIDSSTYTSCQLFGQLTAQAAIERAKIDRTKKYEAIEFTDSTSGYWYGKPSEKDYAKRQWRPFILDSPNQMRCPPPPDSWSKDMRELRIFHEQNQYSAIAWKWKSTPVWDQVLDRKMFHYGLDRYPLKAALIYSAFHIARYDATLSAWEAKYHYMGIRPFQYDREFQPILIQTPNFPGYPAGHTTVAGSLSELLSHFFPEDREELRALALECSESRFEGGVHFRTDNEVGLQQGAQVGNAVIEKLKLMEKLHGPCKFHKH